MPCWHTITEFSDGQYDGFISMGTRLDSKLWPVHYGEDAADVGVMLRALTRLTCLCIVGALTASGWGIMVEYYYTLGYMSMHSRISRQPTTTVCCQCQLRNHYLRSFTQQPRGVIIMRCVQQWQFGEYVACGIVAFCELSICIMIDHHHHY